MGLTTALFGLGCGALFGVDFDASGGKPTLDPDGSAPDGGSEALDPLTPDADGRCPARRKLCAGLCYSVEDPKFGCGVSSCEACAAPAHGAPTCNGAAACDVECGRGYEKSDGACTWKPKTWKVQTTGLTRPLAGIWGTETGPIYAVGGASWSADQLILRSDGNSVWTQEPVPGTSHWTAFYAIWGSGNGNIYAVGATGNESGCCGSPKYYYPRVLHSTGNGGWAAPSVCPLPGTSGFMGVWGSSASDVYLVGPGICHRLQDGSWRFEDTTHSPSRIWGSGATDVYAVGGDILHSVGDGKWQKQEKSSTSSLVSIWGSGPADVYAVSASEILHSTGSGTWTPQTSSAVGIADVGGSGPDDVYIVGANGTILHSVGDGSWTRLDSGVTVNLKAIFAKADGSVYVVGDQGTILHGQ
ncbi:MAG TPA: hypothetical protein VM925_17615 [Labilithrix sp.]|nr:hypothetical protein [Labilithrix sp.]